MPAAASLPESCPLLERRGKRVRPRETKPNHCDVRRGCRRLTDAPGEQGVSLRLVRLQHGHTPVVVHLVAAVHRRCGGGERRPQLWYDQYNRAPSFYHLPVKWQLRLPVVLSLAGRICSQWSEMKMYNTDVSSQKKNNVCTWCPHTFLYCVGGSQPLSHNPDSLVSHYFWVPAQKRHTIKWNDFSHADNHKNCPFSYKGTVSKNLAFLCLTNTNVLLYWRRIHSKKKN